MAQARDEAGNIWEVDAQGNAVRLVTPAGQPSGQVFSLPKSPKEIAAEAERAADNARADRTEARQAGNDAIANQLKSVELQIKQAELTGKGKSANEGNALRDRLSRLNQLVGALNRVQTLYDGSIGTTKGVGGLVDYMPTDDAKRFDAAGAALSQQGLAAFRVPGTGTVSDRDAMMFDRANLPTAATRDAAIEEQLLGLRSRVEEEMKALGQPVPKWEGSAAPQGQQAENELDKAAAFNDTSPPDLPPANEGGNNPVGPVASGGGLRDLARPDINSMVQSMMAAGAGLATINSALKAKGASPIPMAEFARAKQWMAQNPGKAYPVNAKEKRSLTMLERLAASPLGSGVANYANAATAGTAAALAGERGKGALDAMQAVNPNASLLGNIAGGITGAGAGELMLGAKLAGTAAAKFAPRIADAAYGGLYGFNEAEDGAGASGAATGALGGVLGGAIGERVVRGAGKALSGVTDPAVQYLRGLGVPLTAGQALGGIAKSVEDKATSTPIIGDMIAKRRMEGLEGFDRAAMTKAASPIAFTPENIGKEGVDEMLDAAGNAYDNATAGARVELDPQYAGDFTDIAAMGESLPDDLRARFALALNNRVNPINDAGAMTGETYQQAMRGLKSYKGEATKPGFEQDYRGALSAAQDALTAQMMRGGGDGVVSGLRAADDAYRGIKTVEDAAMRADGANYVFTPSQLQDALKKTDRKFPGSSPLNELADMGQQVLPSRIPDSGTAGRAAQLIVPGAVGGAAGYGASGDISGAGAGGLGLTLALLAGGTKTGQRAITAALLDRPEALTRAGKLLADLAKFGGGVGAGTATPLLVGQ